MNTASTLDPTLPESTAAVENPAVGIDQSVGDFTYDVKYNYDAGTGLTENTVRYRGSWSSASRRSRRS
jgi:Fe-S cluster assembly protein SufB